MSWTDRDYNQHQGFRGGGGVLRAMMMGSVPLFTVFGIRVRAHATLIMVVTMVMLFGLGQGFTWQDRLLSMSALFIIVLLHEFGHCFAARAVGGEADDILMTPIGGLAFARPPRRPLPVALTVAAGPAVNVVICVLCAGLMLLSGNRLPRFNVISFEGVNLTHGWLNVYIYSFWIYTMSLYLFLFNLIPCWPFDGGQLLEAALWPKLGAHGARAVATNVGLVVATGLFLFGLWELSLMLMLIAGASFWACWQQRQMLRYMGPHAVTEDYATDYSASLRPDPPARRRHLSRRVIARARRRAEQDRADQERVDAILDKVSSQGMNSLTRGERRALRQATERQRQRDEELLRGRS